MDGEASSHKQRKLYPEYSSQAKKTKVSAISNEELEPFSEIDYPILLQALKHFTTVWKHKIKEEIDVMFQKCMSQLQLVGKKMERNLEDANKRTGEISGILYMIKEKLGSELVDIIW